MNVKYGVIVLMVIFILMAGCTTKCIPVKPTGIIYDQTGECYVIIENTSFSTHGLFGFDCKKIKVNETNWVKFDGAVTGAPISEICEDHK